MIRFGIRQSFDRIEQVEERYANLNVPVELALPYNRAGDKFPMDFCVNFPYLLPKFLIDTPLVMFYNIEQLYYYIEQEKNKC